MATSRIFREAALERLSTPDRLDQSLTVVGAGGWVLLWGLVALVLGGIAWAVIVVVPVTVQGQGILLGPGGLLDVSSGSQGRVISLEVRPGQLVKPGMKVARLDQPQLQEELVAARGELTDTRRQKELTLEFQVRRREVTKLSIESRRRGFVENIDFLTKDIGWIQERVDAQEQLAAKGHTTREKMLQVQSDLGRAREELARNKSGLHQLADEETKITVDEAREQLDMDLKIAMARRKVETLVERLRDNTEVLSAYGGRIVEIKVNPGEMLDRGTPLFTIVPDGNPAGATPGGSDGVAAMVAMLYVPSSAGKQVQPGMEVQVAVSTAPREEYGFILGRVQSVAEVPATAEGMLRVLKNKQLVQTLSNNAAPFEVVVELFTDPATPSGFKWSSSRGPDLQINNGTLVQANIETRNLPILALAIPPLRRWLAPPPPAPPGAPQR
jgi:HlyD family secretion protein